VIAREVGSSPIETVTLLAILLLPIAPAVMLFAHLSDALAAESIARHSLRAAILQAEDTTEVAGFISESVQTLGSSWQKSAEHRFVCDPCEAGGLAMLEVQVGNAVALQVAGLEPK